MVDVTAEALEEFKKILDLEENKGLGVKIKATMTQSGCCGPTQSYEMGLVDKGEDGDRMEEKDTVRFFMDEDTLKVMGGFVVDFTPQYGFVVKDPNAQAAPSCGCGDAGHGGSCC